MSFIGNSIRNYCVNYFNFKGRTGRAEFWTITLILVVMSVLLNSLSSSLQTLFNLLTIIPTMAMVMRRANDSNLSKVVVVLYYVFSFMGVILILVSLSAVAAVTMFSHGLSSNSTGVYTVISLILISFFTIVSTIIAIILWLVIACRKTRKIPSSTKDSAAHFATDFTTDSSMDSNSDSTADRYNVKR